MRTATRPALALAFVAVAAPLLLGAESSPAIDFDGFLDDSQAARELRDRRIVDLDRFKALAAEGAVILDTRSRAAFERRHLSGAAHLNFSDITADTLRRIIGSRDQTVLIYCNNNFELDEEAFPRKIEEAALNIPTFIALYSYGYRNVYELGGLFRVDDPRLEFDGSRDGSSEDRPSAPSG